MTQMLWSYNTPYFVHGFHLISFSFPSILRLLMHQSPFSLYVPSRNASRLYSPAASMHLHSLAFCRLLPTIPPISFLANFFRLTRIPLVLHAS
jgi:hypothetical protein